MASRAYLRRCGVPAHPQDLLTHNCLHYPRPQEAPVWSFEPADGRADAERTTVPVSGTLSANNSEALREAAQAGVGIALLPDFSAQAGLQSGRLVPVLPSWRPVGAFAEHIYAIRPYAQHVPRAATVFVEFLRNSLSSGFGKRDAP
jgi:DNA-binding transcriptional LysR family regulator